MGKSIDEILTEEIHRQTHSRPHYPDGLKDVAVLLSGGVDSLSVAFAAHRNGLEIYGYSFVLDKYLKTHPNEYTYDFFKAKEVCEIMGWAFRPIVIECPPRKLNEDWYKLVRYGCRKKTHYECMFPFLYVYPKIRFGSPLVLTGWAADGYYGMSRKANQYYSQTRELQVEFMDKYFRPENQAGYRWHERIAEKSFHILYSPYLSKPVKEYFYDRDWETLNKPQQKNDVRQGFKPEFDMIGDVKKHLNLQLGSGVSVLFETLLKDKEINFKNRTRIMDVCKDWEPKSQEHNIWEPSLEKFME